MSNQTSSSELQQTREILQKEHSRLREALEKERDPETARSILFQMQQVLGRMYEVENLRLKKELGNLKTSFEKVKEAAESLKKSRLQFQAMVQILHKTNLLLKTIDELIGAARKYLK